jgi:hypothetical protein
MTAKRKQHTAAFKAQLALAALWGVAKDWHFLV